MRKPASRFQTQPGIRTPASIGVIPTKNKTVADCIPCSAILGGKPWMHISMHGDGHETQGAKYFIELATAMEEDDIKWFVVMASKAELSHQRDARVRVPMEDTFEERLVGPVEYVESVLMGDWSDDDAASDHWNKHWNARSAPWNKEWPDALNGDGGRLSSTTSYWAAKLGRGAQ